MFTHLQEKKIKVASSIWHKYKTIRKIYGFLLLILSNFYLEYLLLVKFLIPRYSNAYLNLQQLINKSKAALLLGLLCLLRCILFNRRY